MTTSRRAVLGGLAGLGLAGRVPLALAGEVDGASAAAAVLVDLPVGERFAGSWVLLDAYPPVKGGLTLVIAEGASGPPLRVDAVLRGDPPKAPVVGEALELFTMDGGGGVAWQSDSLLAALHVLLDRLEARLPGSGLRAFLTTHDRRVAAFPSFMGRAASELAPS